MRFLMGILSVLLIMSCTGNTFAQTSLSEPVIVAVSAPPTMVPVPEPAAPPQWAQDVLMSAEGLPIVGPLVAKALVYAGILAAILSALVLCLLTILNALSGVLNFSGLATAVLAIQDFKNGKIMYWLKYFSLFNAQKKPTSL